MKVLLIPDKFKGSATANEVVNAVTKGIKRARPSTEIHSFLASDGGDGFLEAVCNYLNIKKIKVKTRDPLGRALTTFYLLDKDNDTAYVEMAKASGMELLTVSEQNPMATSTYGTGLLLKDAILKGAKTIYIGLGGSATNDGGIGIAKALGYVFKDDSNKMIDAIGENLSSIQKISLENSDLIKNVSFFAVNDVQNPLFGPDGAAHVYGKQKGATENEISILDAGLKHLDKIVQKQLHIKNANVPGAGAAGGTAYGLKTFLNAEFVVGIDFLLELAKIPELLTRTSFDFIITGEGKIDSQTLHGKLINGVVQMGKRFHIPVIGICGKLAIDAEQLVALGMKDTLEISDATKSLEYNMKHAPELIEFIVYNYFNKTEN
ncbi:MAG: glycerate kinase [Flavobacteriaceae bacterium]|nr:MAG: glycerate kinase [Flavobacteriaceae bacterium]